MVSRTGSPQSPLSVMGPRNCCAARVMIGSTRAPPWIKSRATSAALYAAMLPETASATVGRAPSGAWPAGGGAEASGRGAGDDGVRPDMAQVPAWVGGRFGVHRGTKIADRTRPRPRPRPRHGTHGTAPRAETLQGRAALRAERSIRAHAPRRHAPTRDGSQKPGRFFGARQWHHPPGARNGMSSSEEHDNDGKHRPHRHQAHRNAAPRQLRRGDQAGARARRDRVERALLRRRLSRAQRHPRRAEAPEPGPTRSPRHGSRSASIPRRSSSTGNPTFRRSSS